MIDPFVLEAVAQRVTALGFSDGGIASVRAGFPELRLTFCLEDEMGAAAPYREYAGFSLYLVNQGDHCLSLTDDPAAAGGVVVAEAG